jgi:phosphoribosylglycinamide formyltransferase-1
MKKIAIFASGSGTNAEAIHEYLNASGAHVEIALVLTNNKNAGVIPRMEKHGYDPVVFGREDLCRNGKVEKLLESHKIGLVVLAGFLWLMPARIVKKWPVVNIHPALLPKYGGKGMYGERVHRAVIDAGEKESGISIHWVNERYDEGQVLFQERCPVSANDTPESLAAKIHRLEHAYYPRVVASLAGS